MISVFKIEYSIRADFELYFPAETARQLQEALERMESKLATPSSTPGKVTKYSLK